jgi:hypothetical protein
MGPQNFILVNNDVRDALPEGELCVYADDTSHLLSDKSPTYENITKICNTQAERMFNYCNVNSFMLNLLKTSYIIFHSTHSKVPDTLDIKINGQALTRATQTDFLGLTVTDTLSWKPQVTKICSKLSSTCFLLKKLSKLCPFDILMSIYYAHIQSHVTHGIIFWGFSSCAEHVLIMQKKAIRILCKKPHKEHCKPLFKDNNILTIYGLLVVEACHRVMKNPTTFQKNTAVHNHDTRSKNQVHVIGAGSTLTTKGPFHACTKVFNHLEPFLSAFTTPENVKKKLKPVLSQFPFYSMHEFYETDCTLFIKTHEMLQIEKEQAKLSKNA